MSSPPRGLAITATAPTKFTAPPGADFNVLLIGAGVRSVGDWISDVADLSNYVQNIMFGSDEGPWKYVIYQSHPTPAEDPSLSLISHSIRLEHRLGPRLKIVALVDPSVARAESVLKDKRATFSEAAYRDTKVFKTIDDYKEATRGSPDPQ